MTSRGLVDMSKKRPVGGSYQIDFLATSPSPEGGVESAGNTYRVVSPWGLARFGKVILRGGWWRFDCVGAPSAAEIRLSSTLDPLVVITAGQGGGAVRLRQAEYDVRLLISPWPGEYSFSSLRLMKLGGFATAVMLSQAAGRLVRRKGAMKILVRAARQLLAGQALGLRTNPPQQDQHQLPASEASTTTARPLQKVVRFRDVVAMVGEADLLHKDAAAIVRDEFEKRPEIKAIYSDVLEGGRLVPRPEWDLSLSSYGAFTDVPVFFRAGAGASTLQSIADHCGDSAIGRIPLPLVKRGSSAPCFERSLQAIDIENLPLVSAIIPTKYRMDLLAKCLAGLATRTAYPKIEVVIVDNGVVDDSFARLLDEASRSFVVRVVEDKGDFNFSRLMNAGVAASNGQIVLSLNDDVEAIDQDWLSHMVGSALTRNVGAVGPRLIYPDGSIQHAGVVLGLGGTCAHLWRGLSPEAAQHNPYVMSPGKRMAITGACLAVRRSTFERVNGFDEGFPVAYNDIDFCLRLHQAGMQNFYRGDICLIHHEGQSRGVDDATIAKRKRQSMEGGMFLERWADLLNSDPSFSPAFDPTLEIGVAHRANFLPASEYEPANSMR